MAAFTELKRELGEVKNLLFKVYLVNCGPQEGAIESALPLPYLPIESMED